MATLGSHYGYMSGVDRLFAVCSTCSCATEPGAPILFPAAASSKIGERLQPRIAEHWIGMDMWPTLEVRVRHGAGDLALESPTLLWQGRDLVVF
jgi:hypothetical protein